jgi:hypothetical protein
VNCGKEELTLHTRSGTFFAAVTSMLTTHRTAIHIATQLTSAKFEVFVNEAGSNIIGCEGIGFRGISEADP